MIDKIIQILNTHPYFVFFVSICSLLGFFMTVYLMFKTHNIDKVLRRMETAKEYNKKRKYFIDNFNAFRKSILDENLTTRTVVSDLRVVISEYKNQFKSIMTWNDKCIIYQLSKKLNVNHGEIDWSTVCRHLESLAGRLSKKEEI